MTKKELRKISLQFRTLSSQMLKIDSQEEINCVKIFFDYITNTPFIMAYISDCHKEDYDFAEIYKNKSWNDMLTLPDTQEAIVDYDYTITEAGKELDLSKLDIDELRAQFKKLKNKNLEIVDLRKHIEEKLQKMLRRNTTRTKFAERFRNIIDEYNAGGSQNDDFYERLLQLMEELRAEEERHIKEDLSEAELELFDLLRKEHLTSDEEKRVKLAAKELYNTLTEKRNELFIVGWQNDPQPKERVKGEIVYILNKFLPECYDREIFLRKSTLVFDHIVDQAITGYNWVA